MDFECHFDIETPNKNQPILTIQTLVYLSPGSHAGAQSLLSLSEKNYQTPPLHLHLHRPPGHRG